MDTILLNKTWISGQPVQVDNLTGTAFTGEAGAHTFIIAGKDVYGNDVPITGEITAKFLASNQVTVPLVGSIGNDSAFITLSDTCYLVPGRFVLSIFATNGNYTTCIYCGVGNVFATSSDIVAYPTTAVPDLNQLIRDVQAAISSVPADYSALINSIATTFDPQKTGGYGIGEYVWYNGVLYRFKEPHTGGWQASHVDQVILANDLTSVAAVASAGVRYDIGQGLSDTQKATARANINAQEALTIDAAPTEGSTNPVQSGGVYTEVAALKSAIDFDEYLINSGTYIIKADDLESGQWSYSTKADNPARARIKNLLPVRAGMKITYTNTTFDTYFGVLETPTSQTYIQAGVWKTNGNGSISITQDGWLTFIIRNHADPSTAVNPANYDSTVVILTDMRGDIDATNALIYAGRNETANVPQVLTFFNSDSLDQFGILDMPRNSCTVASPPSKFLDLPDGWNVYGWVYVERRSFNGAGNVSHVIVRDYLDPTNAYESRFVETLPFGGWSKMPTQKEMPISRTYNLLDKNNAALLHGYLGAEQQTYKSSELARTIVIPCDPDTEYVVSRPTGYYANTIGFSAQIPESGGSVDVPSHPIDEKTVDGIMYRHYKSTANANYMLLYYYNGNDHDPSGTDKSYLESIMISKGGEYRAYRPYQSGVVKYRELAPVNAYGVFGVRFQRGAANPAMMRTYDAEGLIYRQQTGNTIERSDFDNVFPWCDMRECNVTVDSDGKKTIVYKGETGFSRNNNTYIEVPAFYFKRTVVNGIEEWAVSGRPFSGADIEPWFVNSDGTIAKYRYIAKYEGHDLSGGQMSVTGAIPKTNVTPSACRAYCEANRAKLMSIEAWLAIGHLMVIENCTFNLQGVNIGVSYLAYSMDTSGWNKAVNTSTGNTVVLQHNASDLRLSYMNIGDTIYLSETGGQDLSDPRTITAFSIDSDTQVTIQFDGAAYAVTAGMTYCFPAVQRTGRTDGMTYVNGRPINNAMNSPFVYRGIENIYGNAWTYADGITWQRSDGKYALGDLIPAFTAPYQYESGNDNTTQGWITTLGYDRAMPWATLAETVLGTTSATGKNTYITDEWNTRPSGTGPAQASVGGGWDHQGENGMFCMRIVNYDLYPNWLYGYRAMID